jgi:spore maturation protein CgeB
MRVVVFCHSLMSDWNHGNAHFLRGVVAELLDRGHDVRVLEPLDGWSRANLVVDQGRGAIDDVRAAFPTLRSEVYDHAEPDVAALTDGADLVLVHEWNEPSLVAAVGAHKAAGGYRLLFHDTHHRAVTAPDDMARFDLSQYDGVLAFGAVIRELYLERGWAERAWTWHEAADARVFHPRDDVERRGDLVWIGNWGDGERTAELHEYLLDPVHRLGPVGARARRPLPRRPRRSRSPTPASATAAGSPTTWHPAPSPPRRHRARAAAPLRRGAAGHPDHPAVRGAGVRHPAGVRPLGRRRAPVHPRQRLPGRRRRRADGVAPARRAARPGPRPVAARARPGDRRGAAHLRPPRRRAAGDRRRARPRHLDLGSTCVSDGLDIAFFGSSLVSSWWNGSCTYYRGIIRGLHELGHRVTFYEPIAYERQEHRDIADPDWARVVIYEAPDEAAVRAVVEQARGVDMVVKTSGVGVFDDVLEDACCRSAPTPPSGTSTPRPRCRGWRTTPPTPSARCCRPTTSC